jgi:carboxypeptidase C (cathepsin A)
MNGGPGGSSLIGALTENGPFYLDDTSFADPSFNKTGVPKLNKRPMTWVGGRHLHFCASIGFLDFLAGT